ncbi:MAG: FAD-binding oxidoreductase [Promethearchaeota archaeon]|nr:MAG: FAD-binding oxidoreductase [Candidatus Lokiarchaeota archaeon]
MNENILIDGNILRRKNFIPILQNMNKELIYRELVKISGSKNISNNSKVLGEFSKDLSFFSGKEPKYVIWPKNRKQIQKTIKLANSLNFSIIPVSSSSGPRHHGDTIPRNNQSVIVNLSKLNKIINLDRKNRVLMIEPGVTFGKLIPQLSKKGLRILTPLHPRASKSVLTAALEREPVTIPRYMWDSSDPLLCTEVYFGNGELFKTGAAAGPGTIKQQKKAGQAQVNPMGPTQFSPFRLIQGAQGSIGIVTWVTLKLELKPSIQKVYHFQSNNIEDLLDIQYDLLKYRLCDELFILNNLNLASLIKENSSDISQLVKQLKKWNLIFIISGKGQLANERISYLEGDIQDIMKEKDIRSLITKTILEKDILKFINQADVNPWRLRLFGGYQDIFFISNYERIKEYIALVEQQITENLGVYIQAINQGTSYHCEFDIYYNPNNKEETLKVKEQFLKISNDLIDSGAFFNRPYGLWAKEVYKKHEDSTQKALKKVKRIFDPKNVLNPGVLCFGNETK